MDRRNDFFNTNPPTILHIDLNSCFATIEQQANPLLRGKVIGIVPMGGNNGCVIAPSIEAKKLGIKTGMRVFEAKQIYPKIIIRKPDPCKYRFVHMKIRKILDTYSPKVQPKSIDEFVVDLKGTESFKRGMVTVGCEIKEKIKAEVGDYLTTSVGIANNRCLAKLAAGLQKPDGLDVIDKSNYWEMYHTLSLRDLPGIDVGFSRRLAAVNVHSIPEMYEQTLIELKTGFRSVLGEDWYARLRGWEVDEVEWGTKSFSNQRVIYPAIIAANDILKVVMFLLWKTTSRMRIAGYQTRRVFFGFNCNGYEDAPPYYWSTHKLLPEHTFSSAVLYKAIKEKFYAEFKRDYVSQVFVGVSELKSLSHMQLNQFEDLNRTRSLYHAVDKIEHRYGKNTIKPAIMLGTEHIASHRIPFNSTKEMEQYLFNGDNLLDD
jgi:DNA polymerase-4